MNAIVGANIEGKFYLVDANKNPVKYGAVIDRRGYATDDTVTGGSAPTALFPYGTMQLNHSNTIVLTGSCEFKWLKESEVVV